MMRLHKAKVDRRLKYTVLRQLVDARLGDARALLKTGIPKRRNGAVYLGGYAVECALKARICVDRGDKHLDPSFFTHDLRTLAKATHQWVAIATNPQTFSYLESQWEVGLRYEMRSLDPSAVSRYLEKAKEFSQWLFNE